LKTRKTPDRAALICMQHSGSARFYSGRITVRCDVIEPPDLALVVSHRDAGSADRLSDRMGMDRLASESGSDAIAFVIVQTCTGRYYP